MKSISPKPWFAPQPVLIIGTYNKEGVANAMNAAWAGQWDMKEIMISMGNHVTTDNLKLGGEFTVAFATKNPFRRNRDELENKGLDSAGGTQSKFMGFQSLHNSFVEVSDESCHKQEYSILCHERFWQSIPAKAIVHVIEDAFLATTKIVEFHDVSCTRLVIVSQYTSVGIFAFPNIKVSLYSPLSLYDKTIRFSFPFLNKDRIQLKLNTVDFNSFPSS